eukprot:5997439-Pleurochrysis_carterae.AAC.1
MQHSYGAAQLCSCIATMNEYSNISSITTSHKHRVTISVDGGKTEHARGAAAQAIKPTSQTCRHYILYL